MTRPPCVRLYPACPGNPRLRIEGESPQSGKDIRSALMRATCCRRPLCDVKFQTRALLKIAENAKEVLGLRITSRTEHPDQTLGLGPGRFAKLFKADGCLDIIAQDRLAGFDIPAQHRIDTFSKKRFGKLLVFLDAGLHQFLEASCLRHLSLHSPQRRPRWLSL